MVQDVEVGRAAESGWTALSEARPPNPSPALLVTNNIKARNAHGFASHVWLVSMTHGDDKQGYSAFEDGGFSKVEGLTHWRYALPEEQASA